MCGSVLADLGRPELTLEACFFRPLSDLGRRHGMCERVEALYRPARGGERVDGGVRRRPQAARAFG
jgi:hypothetical protein